MLLLDDLTVFFLGGGGVVGGALVLGGITCKSKVLLRAAAKVGWPRGGGEYKGNPSP